MMVLYRCDAEKNTECKKRGCSHNNKIWKCRCTSNPDYAQKDENGQPIIAFIHFDDQPPLMVNGGTDW